MTSQNAASIISSQPTSQTTDAREHLRATIATAARALDAAGDGEGAIAALAAGLLAAVEDVDARVARELNLKNAAAVSRVAIAAIKQLRERGVDLPPAFEDEIDESVMVLAHRRWPLAPKQRAAAGV